jgi:hypothetical protein
VETVWVRKAQGGCSIGHHTWAKDGDVVEMSLDQARPLLAIDGGEFTIVDAPAKPARKTAGQPPAAKVPEVVPEGGITEDEGGK